MAESIRGAGHLPKQRPGGKPADPYELPRQRRGVTPQMHGRYPDYDVLENAEHWDAVTREQILARVNEVPPVRFFTAAEERCLRPFLDVFLAQDSDPRIPVFEMVDQKLHEGKLDGFQYEDMPDDRDTWRLVARGLDEAAGGDFAAAGDETRHDVVGRFADGGAHGTLSARGCGSRPWPVSAVRSGG